MKPVTKRILYWAPRILSILFALFLGIFALDVFGAGYSVGETIIALFMHLMPTFGLLIIAALAWRWEWIGAVTFAGFALWYLVMVWGLGDWVGLALLVVMPLIVGVLYLIDWRYHTELRPR
jgi:hypothetical protein